MRAKLIVAAIVLLLAGGITWAVVAQTRWEARCHRAGGHVVSHFEGYITTYIYTYDAKGNITSMVPQMTPQYSYTCDGLAAGVTL